jgi:hypothetical protein
MVEKELRRIPEGNMNEINFSDKIVYLAAPKRLLSSDLYDRAFRFMLARSKGVMNPRWMFANNQDWLNNYEERLEPCNVMVIVSDDGNVGKGVYLEYNYFFSRHCKIYHYDESEFNFEVEQSLYEVKRLQIVDDEDWSDYAIIQY